MKISELTAGQGKIEVEGVITAMKPPRTFNKNGSAGKVANATLKDDSGQITVSLWNEQADQIKIGDRIKISNGYVSEWQGEKQLSTGKFGKLEVLESGNAVETPAPENTPATVPPKPKHQEEDVETDDFEVDADNFDEEEVF